MYIEVRDAVKPSRELLPFPPTSRISTRLRGRHHSAQEQWGKRKLALDEETGEGFTEKGTLRGSQRLVRTCGVEEKKHTHEKGGRMRTGPGREPGKECWALTVWLCAGFLGREKMKALEKFFRCRASYPDFN